MRTLHVIPSVDDEFSGPGNVALSVLSIERALGVWSTVVCGHHGEPGVLVKSLRTRAEVVLWPHRGLLARVHGSAGIVWSIVKHVRRCDVVIAHSFFNLPSVIASLAARCTGTPVVIAPHGTLDDFDTLKHAQLKRILALLWRLCLDGSVVWCMTQREALELNTYGARVTPTVVPPNVSALVSRRQARVAEQGPASAAEDGCVVTFMGRINYKKGIPRLIDAFDECAGNSDLLILAGSGDDDYFETINEQIAVKRRREQIQVRGWVDGEAKELLFSMTDVFVLLSDRENFAISVTEAMAHGLPVFVTDEVAVSDVVERHGAGVVTSTKPEDIRRGLGRLLSDRAFRAACAANAREAVRINYSEEAVTQAYERMLRHVRTS